MYNNKKEDIIILTLVLIFIMTSLVMAITLNTINPETLESVNITFSSAGSDTSYHFNLSKNATIFSASMNITGYPYDTGYGLQYPDSPSIDISNDGDSDWNYTGIYDFTNRTLDFSSEINDYLENCTQDSGGYCNVTVNVSSESAGIIGLDVIHISYDFVTKKNYTIVENKTNYTERWYNTSLADVIDDMEPAELDNLSQTKYDELKNIALYQKIVFFNNYTIDPDVTSPLNYNINDTNNSRFVIKLNKTLDDNTYAFLKIHNMTLYSRSGNSYFVKLNPLEITNLSNTSYLRGIWEIPINGKLGKNLTNVNLTKNYNVTIWLFEDVNCSTAEPILSPYITEGFKGNHSFNETCSDESNYVAAEINGSNINKTANESIVKKILLNEGMINMSNYNAQLGTGSDIITNSYDGTAVRVAVVDSGIAYSDSKYHYDLPTPVWKKNYLRSGDTTFVDQDGHGTHVTGTIMGDGSRNSDYKGIAPGADLIVIKICGVIFGNESCGYIHWPSDAPIEDAISHDSDVISTSLYDPAAENEYTGESELLDKAVNGKYLDSGGVKSYPVIVVGVGNKNKKVMASATAKNIISVGAAKVGNSGDSNFNEPAADDFSYSNYGPIDTGSGNRVKPDVIAPGYLTSTFTWYDTDDCKVSVGDDYYCTKTGTSMATPVVSGIATSLLHAYPVFKTLPEAVKAMIINSAVELPTGTVPLSKQGRGHVNAFYSHYNDNSIYKTVVWSTGGIVYGDPDDEYPFSVPSDFEEIKATLVYIDDAGSNTQQDLDLYMYDSNDNEVSYSRSWADTVENISITSGPSGTWKVKVSPWLETDRVTYYSVVVSIRLKDPDLDMSIDKSLDTIINPGTYFAIQTDLKNYGYVTVGSYIELEVPSGFTLEFVNVYRDDGTSIQLDDSQLYKDGNEYRVTVGETVYNHDRRAIWLLKENFGKEKKEGIYAFNISYGGMNHAEEKTSTNITVNISKCDDGEDNDGDTYIDCADADCIQGSKSSSGFCCGGGCSSDGATCSDASTSGFTCADGNCNNYNEACCSGDLERNLQCSGTSLACTGGQGSCEYTTCGAPEWCDEITPSDTTCENSPGSYDELACEVSGTNCYYEAEYFCNAPSGCDEKDEFDCSTNSGFQCEWQSTYDDNVVEECEATSCGAISECDEQQPGYGYAGCTGGVQTYFADKCTSSCQGEDRGDNICRSSTFATGCTADVECNGVVAGTGNCDASCDYIDNIPPHFTDSTPQNQTLTYGTILSYDINATDETSFDCFAVNDSMFKIDCNGLLDNNTVLGVAKYYLNITINDTSNNINSTVMLVNVTKASTTTTLTTSPASPITYGATSNFSCVNDAGLTITLYVDDVDKTSENHQDVVRSAKVAGYNVSCIVDGNQNYTGDADETNYVINKATPILTKYLNGVDNNLSVTYPQEVNASAYTTGGTVKTFRDSADVSSENGLNVSLSGGYYEYVFNVTGNQNYTDVSSVYLYANISKGTSVTTLITSPASPITYGTASNFSCVNDAGLTVILYVDGVDKTNENHLDIVRGAKASGYNVSCIASGNQNYTGDSDESSYIINKATPTASITNDTALTKTYDGVITNIGISESNSGDGDVSYVLWKDGVNVGGSDSEGSVGTYSYKVNTTGGENYSAVADLDSESLVISQATPSLNLNSLPSWSETYGTETNVSGSGCPSQLNCNLYKDDISVSNPEVIMLGAGNYNYTYNTTGNNNYTIGSVSNILVINQANPVSGMSLTGTSPITYGSAGDFEGTESNNGDGDCVYELFRDGSLVSNPDTEVLGGGSYSYDSNTTGCVNYTNGELSDSLTVNKATPSLTFLANGGTSNLSLTYPQQINMSVSASGGSVGLDRDGVDVLSENGLNVTLGVGGYIYRANITGNENYTDVGYEYYNVTISQATSLVYTYLNHVRSNLTTGNDLAVWLNGTRETGEGDIKLYVDNNLYNEGSSPLVNNTFFSVSLHNITTIYESTQNYSGSYETWWLNVSDTTPPTLVEILDFNETFVINGDVGQGENVSFNVTVTDVDSEVESVWLKKEL